MQPQIIQRPKIIDERGNLTFLQNPNHIPFPIARIFWTYSVPGGEIRGGHAYKTQQEIIVALSGSFDVVVTNADNTLQKFSLNRSYYGLYLPARTWRHTENFSTNALSLHLSSTLYSREDYLYNFDSYVQLNNGK